MGLAPEGGLVGPLVLRDGCRPITDCMTSRAVRMSGKRGKYTPEFGEQAGRWVRLARAAGSVEDTGAVLDADERAAFEPLRRENAELRLDCQFLGKAAAFFASEQDR
jgi:transposase